MARILTFLAPAGGIRLTSAAYESNACRLVPLRRRSCDVPLRPAQLAAPGATAAGVCVPGTPAEGPSAPGVPAPGPAGTTGPPTDTGPVASVPEPARLCPLQIIYSYISKIINKGSCLSK